jgi:NAD(P)-dependent dehydrogenase (short-subunit alcohol dehydrogenase family)
MGHVEAIRASIADCGREAWFFNVNAADPARRAEVLDTVTEHFRERGQGETLRVLLHSLAFGTLRPFFADEGPSLDKKQMDMTCDVMAHSLVYWAQDVVSRDLMVGQGRIFAMTSSGARSVWTGYGAVSAAKAALESHVRQLALELSPRGITVNAICAGVTDTPALAKIPGSDSMTTAARRKNPSGRLTEPVDVARALVALAQPCTYWMTANTLFIDGGEANSGG